MLFKIKSYFLFLVKSTNQHGVHSPFVYNLVTKCFYNRTKRKSYEKIQSIISKKSSISITLNSAKLLNRTIPYFDYKKVLVLKKKPDTIVQIISENNEISTYTSFQNNVTFDLVFLEINYFMSNIDILDAILENTHNDSLLLINSIRYTKKNFDIWNTIQKHPKVTVTIDTYSLGFVFFRTEQAKEHFIIRK
ncbi:class I SAM-dependent methyltransferase [Aquimarina litoralis]|uniref:Class I SAM-dependent methyltransferase n=1 Tax=Aquimarina litoralis TaxID=584605 RepID=A0ABN1J9Q3_9FLAO